MRCGIKIDLKEKIVRNASRRETKFVSKIDGNHIIYNCVHSKAGIAPRTLRQDRPGEARPFFSHIV